MASLQTARAIAEQSFLEIRAKILEVGAALDRIERAEGAGELAGDPRMQQLRESLAILQTSGTDRAERIQMVFSDPYEPGWRG